MSDSVDSDQTPRSASMLLALVYLSENLGYIWYGNRKDPDQLANYTSIYSTVKKLL